MEALTHLSKGRATTIVVLAAVGFVAVLALGIGLASYSTRYVPLVVNRVGAAAVYLSSFFKEAPGLVVVQTPVSSSTPVETPSVDTPTTTPVTTTQPPVVKKPVKGPSTSGTYPIVTTTAPAHLSGLPDLTVRIDAVGYLATSSTESFIASTTAPSGMRPAVKFSIKNVGTNIAAPWRFTATIPTQSSYLFYSPLQQPLMPGDSIDYILGFDQAVRGVAQPITVVANFDKAVDESDNKNNTAVATITILGS
jgi:hypothetical protein